MMTPFWTPEKNCPMSSITAWHAGIQQRCSMLASAVGGSKAGSCTCFYVGYKQECTLACQTCG
jgi:hypothetical protein